MASKKKLGLFCGEQNFTLVETEGGVPARVFNFTGHIATGLQSPLETGLDAVGAVASFQKIIREERIDAKEVSLSLPVKDTIIRVFVIPFMRPSEVTGVVEFEAKKYIPFDLKDLSFAYHAIPFTENKVKHLRIVFVAVRRQIIEQYQDVLEQAGLGVYLSEPAPMSFVRALMSKKLIAPEGKVTVLQLEKIMGRIIFIEQGIVEFIREFQINSPALDAADLEPQMVKTRLLNEVRNSLEFYTRQYSQEPVKQMVLLSVEQGNEHAQWLTDELGVTVQQVDPWSIVHSQTKDDMSALNAYGASLGAEPGLKSLFNLSQSSFKRGPSAIPRFSLDPQEYLNILKVFVGAVVLAGAAYAFSFYKLNEYKKQVDVLAGQQGKYVEVQTEDIQAQTAKNNEKLKGYQNVRFKSQITELLVILPSLIPDGLWLNSINISYRKERGGSVSDVIEINMDGQAYSKESDQQILLVNDFVNNLKSSSDFKKFIKNIALHSMLQQQMGKSLVIAFSISG